MLNLGGRLLGEEFSFSTQILPVLTKAGCNSGGCHGAATGQGGFKLSLLGYDPEQDHLNITRELGGRRLDLASPTNSLLLQKATRQIDHEGDRRIQRSSPEYDFLSQWIAGGAPFGPNDLRVTGITVAPESILAGATHSSVQLRVVASLSDGKKEDVTARALYSSNDDSVAEVGRTGEVKFRGSGSTSVMVRYCGQVAAAFLDRPFNRELGSEAWAEFQPQNFVDDLVLARWQRLRIPPSPSAADAEFLRRVRLDLTGRLPSEVEVTDFLAERGSQAKRDALIEQLLKSEEFVDLWTMRFADLLLISGKRGTEAGAQAYHRWVREQLAENRPWNEIVHSLLTAEGEVAQVGPANFLLLANDPRDLSEHVSTMFLGTQIGCARCHAHPADRWTQTDYHQFAAYFARVSFEGGRVRDSHRGEVTHPKTGLAVSPRALGVESAATETKVDLRRQQLAAWLVSPDNSLFARALVNRVWQQLLGRGLVEPVDDLRLTNPATNPELLDALARHFVASGFDLRDLVRTIVRSATYQRSSQTIPGNELDDRFHSHALVKALPAPVLLDAIAQATGVPEWFTEQPEATRAVQLIGTQTPSHALDVLGRCSRERSCESTATAGGGLAQALHLINGDTINRRLRTGILESIRKQQMSNEAAIQTLYLRTLSRLPTSAESAEWNSLLAKSEDREEALEDLLWALLNSRAFVFNH